jgi:hypothetical protein
VIARARIAPRQEWAFSSWLDIRGGEETLERLFNRELVIEWRDRDGGVIHEKNVGKPPWSHPRPLRITGAGEDNPGDQVLGRPGVVLPASALRANVQWYAGFSAIAVPTAFAASTLPVPFRPLATFSCTVDAVASTLPPEESNT